MGLVLLALSPVLQAADLLGLYRDALQNDAQYRAAVQQHRATYQTLEQAYADLRPSVSAEYSYQTTEQGIERPNFIAYDNQFDTTSWTLTLNQPLLRYPAWIRVGQAKVELQAADARLETERQGLVLRVAERYLATLGAQDDVNFTVAEMAAIERQQLQASRRFDLGMGRRTDLHDAMARLATTRAEVFGARQRLDDAQRSLEELTGEPLSGPLAAVRDDGVPLLHPDPADPALWVSQALAHNPRAVARDLSVTVASEEVRRQRAGHYPSLELIGRIRHEDDETVPTGYERNNEIVLRGVLPIYQGGAVAARTEEAQALLDKAQAERDQEFRRLERETQAAYLGVLSSIQRVGALDEAVRAHELAVDAKRKGFEAGIYLILAVLDAERDLYASKREHARARYDYLLNHLRLKQAVGAVGDDDIQKVNGWLR